MMVIERILVYLDGSEASILAARYAIVLAARTGAEKIGRASCRERV